MSHCKYIKKRKKGEHLTYIDRQNLEILVRKNETAPAYKKISMRQMARLLQSGPATISRELKRGRVGPLYGKELTQYYSYSANVAQRDYDRKGTAKGRNIKMGKDHAFANYVSEQILVHKQSPDAIIMRLKRDGNPFETTVSTRTLYSYIERGYIPGVELCHLPRRGRLRKRRYGPLRRAFKGDGKGIEERPKEANTRQEAGHWEMDCMLSGKGKGRSCLLVLSERKHREVLIRKLRSVKAESVVKALDRLERKLGAEAFRERFKSITMDNGPEFSDWRSLERSCVTGKRRTSAYYCHPYSAWERGTVEQAIGMIRRFIPKGSDIGKLSGTDIQGIEYWLNDLPRRILNGESAKIASGRPEAA
ncbi:MAG: IS30 family transposase [Christensenellales bacterium]